MVGQKMSISRGDALIARFGGVWLAPMTGVSDLPFRACAQRLGARYTATEMVASEALAAGRPDAVRRAALGGGEAPLIVQLVGAEARWVASAAQLVEQAGAELIDLNFGCPAKSVTGRACGSALMRDPHGALDIVRRVIDSVAAPVSVKMRLGWDERSLNAGELAARFEEAGVAAITVHGRTRQQFYKGRADWRAVGEVRRAISIPLIVNGDIVDTRSAQAAREQSGAAAVMIGRGAIGRPWLVAQLEAASEGKPFAPPTGEARVEVVMTHLRDSLVFYGFPLGLMMFRKHLAAYVEAASLDEAVDRKAARARLCRMTDVREIEGALRDLWCLGAVRSLAA